MWSILDSPHLFSKTDQMYKVYIKAVKSWINTEHFCSEATLSRGPQTRPKWLQCFEGYNAFHFLLNCLRFWSFNPSFCCVRPRKQTKKTLPVSSSHLQYWLHRSHLIKCQRGDKLPRDQLFTRWDTERLFRGISYLTSLMGHVGSRFTEKQPDQGKNKILHRKFNEIHWFGRSPVARKKWDTPPSFRPIGWKLQCSLQHSTKGCGNIHSEHQLACK